MMDIPAWHAITVDQALKKLGTGFNGLSETDVLIHRRTSGSNALPPPKLPSAWQVWLGQFKSPLVAILLVAAGVSFFLNQVRDGVVILLVVMLNASIGFRQEQQSDAAVQRLLQMSTAAAHVVRDGQERETPIDEVVVGDVLVLDTGDKIPADGRWIEAANIRTDEASLSGEAAPITKQTDPMPAGVMLQDQRCMAWRGTTVVGGRGRMAVTAVGTGTRYGRIVTSLESISDFGTPFQHKLNDFSRNLLFLTLVLGALVFLLGSARALPFEQIFLLTVSIIVSIIPEGLPVVITMSMAWGMGAMAKRNAVVRKLLAVETLGAVTVVATDKTGTLTYGEMMTQRIWVDGRTYAVSGNGYQTEGQFTVDNSVVSSREEAGLDLALRIGALNNDSRFTLNADGHRQPVGDPTELALLVAAEKGGWTQNELEILHPRLGEIPFDAKYKRMVTWHQQTGGVLGTLKGAPAEVLDHCATIWTAQGAVPLTAEKRREILLVFETWADEALRGLAAAQTVWAQTPNIVNPDALGKDFMFVGLFGLADAVRPEVAQAVADMRQAGVRTMMLTGDHQKTGWAIAASVGLATAGDASLLLDGSEIDQLTDVQLSQRLTRTRVATRLTPDHKLRIARLLKQAGEVVAMTGDGINDAPALMAADVGVAVGLTSSDAAKEASDVVLVDGNYSSIVAAITEGRRIYRNIRRALVYLLASNFGELGLIVMSLLVGLPLPLLPTHIIWLNAITDPFLGISLAREPISPLVMKEQPHNPRLPLIARDVWRRIIVASLVLSVSSFFVFLMAHASARSEEEIFALTLTTLAFGEWMLAITARSSIRSTFSLAAPNTSLLVSFFAVGGMQIAILYIPPLTRLFRLAPLSWVDWLIVIAGVLPVLLVEELQKWRLRKRYWQRSLTRLQPA